jgi:hypothetical protein
MTTKYDESPAPPSQPPHDAQPTQDLAGQNLNTNGARVVRMFRAMSINHLSRIASHCPNTTLICH